MADQHCTDPFSLVLIDDMAGDLSLCGSNEDVTAAPNYGLAVFLDDRHESHVFFEVDIEEITLLFLGEASLIPKKRW